MTDQKTVLCFGDSNTWGWDPATRGRFDRKTRWPGVVRELLGEDYWVIEEGLNGRTTVHDDPFSPHRNGLKYLPACLKSHAPVDAVVIMLGTNDFKERFHASAADIAEGIALLGKTVLGSRAGRNGAAPNLLLIAPPPVAKLTEFAGMFRGAEEKSHALAKELAFQVSLLGCDWLDAGTIIRSSDLDGIHFEADQHRLLGEAVAAKLREMLA